MIDPTGQQGRPEQYGLPCPECGALRAPDNTPSCACAQRAADTLRDTRTAEAAAAEDFDPLRIRPYVELDGAVTSGTDTGAGAGTGARAGASSAADVTMPIPTAPPFPTFPADATMPLRAVDPTGPPPPDATTALPTPLAHPGLAPSAGDLSLFEADDLDTAHPDDEEPGSPRRRRALLIATTAAVVAVLAAAGFASGLFSYETPTRDTAAPKDVRAAVPDTSTSASSGSPSASRSASPSASDASPSPSERGSPSPSRSQASASPSASRSADAVETTPTARVTSSSGPENGADNSQGTSPDLVLRLGDTGAEVTELQLRLTEASLYTGEADGTFSSEVESALRNFQWSRGTTEDGLGVYGPVTREKLESETKEP
ncbi:peptidoglycan-binding domain-containing protein [Streptomyces sp. NPDC000618]|uniref:peptidoglycan-binding domain-containing protein n=1 Tax=Streptomyces sp. NPDC000618 TaxID=3154265 RepID=UPI00332651A1